MPKYHVTEWWKYRVTYLVEAESEAAAYDGAYVGAMEEISRDDGEFLDVISVEAVDEAASPPAAR